MNAITCREVEEQLDLYAAGACDPAACARIQRHLADCQTCAAAEREARRLQGILDLHWQAPAGLMRLRATIDKEERRSRQSRRILPFVGLAMAAAALVLLTFGLTGVGVEREETIPANLVVDARNVLEMKANVEPNAVVRNDHPAPLAGDAKLTMPLDTGGRTAADYRQYLHEAQKSGSLPLPPALNLSLELHNRSEEIMTLHLDDERAHLYLELRGPEILRLTRPTNGATAFTPGDVVLAPGQSYFLRVRRLIDGGREHVEYVYWLAPGEYTLTMRFRAPVCRRPANTAAVFARAKDSECVTLTSKAIRIEVVDQR